MPKRIMWKKGMRLTDEILTLSDKLKEEQIGKGLLLASCGRMGLIPCTRPFSISVDVNKEVVEVVSIDCIGLTRNGTLIDVQYDTTFTNSFDTRVSLPSKDTDRRYYLCISAHDSWREINGGLCEPLYEFLVVEDNSPVPDNALPVARIVFDEYCWRTDETDFVPPCLFIASHRKFEELSNNYLRILTELNASLPQHLNTEKMDAVKIFWPLTQQLMITMDKERDVMTPMGLLGNVQKLVSAFVCACTLDEYINIGEPQQYISFINAPYNYKDSYRIIRDGIGLSLVIKEKIEMFQPEVAPPKEESRILPPSIENGQLKQTVKFGSVKYKITNNTPGATVYYTTDGSTPNQSSKSGNFITVESGFTDNWHKEPAKVVVIKLIAYKDGAHSEVETYEAQIKKGNPFTGKQI